MTRPRPSPTCVVLLFCLATLVFGTSSSTGIVKALTIRTSSARIDLVHRSATVSGNNQDAHESKQLLKSSTMGVQPSQKPEELVTAATKSYRLLVAGYNGAATPYTFTPPSTLVVTGNTLKHDTVGDQPSWATFSHTHPIAYIVGENEPGRVYAANINKKDCSSKKVSLKVLGGGGEKGGALTGGSGPVANCIANGILFIANYGSGSASALQLDDDGNILESTPNFIVNYTRVPKGSIGPAASRQDHSYAHQVAADPSQRWVYVPDLGADRIHRLSVPSSGKATEVREQASTIVATGSGPRHMAFYQNKTTNITYAYLASELATTLTAFRVRDSDGRLFLVSPPQLSLPSGVDPGPTENDGNTRTTSEVAVSPDGKFVYVGTRHDPKEDHIAVFKRNATDGSVKFGSWYHSGGINLRHFSLSPDANASYIAAAHQDTGNVTILARNPHDGSLSKTGAGIVGFDQVAFAGFFTGPAATL